MNPYYQAYVLGAFINGGELADGTLFVKVPSDESRLETILAMSNALGDKAFSQRHSAVHIVGGLKRDVESLFLGEPNRDLLQQKEWVSCLICGLIEGGGTSVGSEDGEGLCVEIPAENQWVKACLVAWANFGIFSEQARALRGLEAFDLLGQVYENCLPMLPRAASRAETIFHRLCQGPFRPFPSGEMPRIFVQRIDERAVLPSKSRVSDSGYDLTLIDVEKRMGTVTLYRTGLVVEPPAGFYFDVVARSSIIKTGHMLANNVGVIDRAYRGELLVPIVKIDPLANDLPLPIRLAQMIPRPIVHFTLQEGATLSATGRGDRGFGSSGR